MAYFSRKSSLATYQPRWGSPLARESSIDGDETIRRSLSSNVSPRGRVQTQRDGQKTSSASAAKSPTATASSEKPMSEVGSVEIEGDVLVPGGYPTHNTPPVAENGGFESSMARRFKAAKEAFMRVRSALPDSFDQSPATDADQDDYRESSQQQQQQHPVLQKAQLYHEVQTVPIQQQQQQPYPPPSRQSNYHSTINTGTVHSYYTGTVDSMPPIAPTPSIYSPDQAYTHYLQAMAYQQQYQQQQQQASRCHGPRQPHEPAPGQNAGDPQEVTECLACQFPYYSMSLDYDSSLVRDYMIRGTTPIHTCAQHHQSRPPSWPRAGGPDSGNDNRSLNTNPETSTATKSHAEFAYPPIPIASSWGSKGMYYQSLIMVITVSLSIVVLTATAWYIHEYLKRPPRAPPPHSEDVPKLDISKHVFLAVLAALTAACGMLRLALALVQSRVLQASVAARRKQKDNHQLNGSDEDDVSAGKRRWYVPPCVSPDTGQLTKRATRMLALLDLVLFALWTIVVTLMLFTTAIRPENLMSSVQKRSSFIEGMQLGVNDYYQVQRARIFLKRGDGNDDNDTGTNNTINSTENNDRPSFTNLKDSGTFDLRGAACFIAPTYPNKLSKAERSEWTDFPAICRVSLFSGVLGYAIAALLLALAVLTVIIAPRLISLCCKD